MDVITKKIMEHEKKSRILMSLSKDEKLKYDKVKELRNLQTEEWNKLNFFKNLRKEMNKQNENGRSIKKF